MPSTNIRRDHDALTEVLLLCEAAGTGDHKKVGIRNHFGDICLNVETDNAQEFLNVMSCLDGRELQDELADAEGPRDGYDAVFRDAPH